MFKPKLNINMSEIEFNKLKTEELIIFFQQSNLSQYVEIIRKQCLTGAKLLELSEIQVRIIAGSKYIDLWNVIKELKGTTSVYLPKKQIVQKSTKLKVCNKEDLENIFRLSKPITINDSPENADCEDEQYLEPVNVQNVNTSPMIKPIPQQHNLLTMRDLPKPPEIRPKPQQRNPPIVSNNPKLKTPMNQNSIPQHSTQNEEDNDEFYEPVPTLPPIKSYPFPNRPLPEIPPTKYETFIKNPNRNIETSPLPKPPPHEREVYQNNALVENNLNKAKSNVVVKRNPITPPVVENDQDYVNSEPVISRNIATAKAKPFILRPLPTPPSDPEDDEEYYDDPDYPKLKKDSQQLESMGKSKSIKKRNSPMPELSQMKIDYPKLKNDSQQLGSVKNSIKKRNPLMPELSQMKIENTLKKDFKTTGVLPTVVAKEEQEDEEQVYENTADSLSTSQTKFGLLPTPIETESSDGEIYENNEINNDMPLHDSLPIPTKPLVSQLRQTLNKPQVYNHDVPPESTKHLASKLREALKKREDYNQHIPNLGLPQNSMPIIDHTNLLPDNLNDISFFRNTDRIGAKRLLNDLPDGAFLFRKSSKYYLALVIKHGDIFFNVGIIREENKIKCDTNQDMSPEFETFESFIEYFQMEPLTLMHNNQEYSVYLNPVLPENRY